MKLLPRGPPGPFQDPSRPSIDKAKSRTDEVPGNVRNGAAADGSAYYQMERNQRFRSQRLTR